MQRRVARIVGPEKAARADAVAFGDADVDAAIGGGLGRGRLHELFSAEDEEAASAAGFAAMLAARAASRSPLLWLRTEEAERRGGRLHATGLGEIGVDPAAVLLGVVPDEAALLRAGGDAARCAGLGALVIESWGRAPRYDLTASRRLMLAAEGSGVTVLLLRIDAQPVPSAAETRWSVAPAPSQALAADAPGPPRFDVELTRRRGGAAGLRWRLEWDRDARAFAAVPGAVLPVAGGGARAELPPAPARRPA